MEYLEFLDRQILLAINSWNSPFLDKLIYAMTTIWFWIPFIALSMWILWKHYQKKMLLIVAFFALTIVFTDQSSGFIKDTVQRYRPSHNLEIKDKLHLHQNNDGTVYRGGMYGFVSSHAANSFGWIVLFIYFFYPITKKWLFIFPLCALIFCYTRIYLAVHYPSDILCGAILGILCGFLSLYLYKASIHRINEQATN